MSALEGLTAPESGTYEIYVAGFTYDAGTVNIVDPSYTIGLACTGGTCDDSQGSDSAAPNVIRDLSMTKNSTSDNGEIQKIQFLGEVTSDYSRTIDDGNTLKIEIAQTGGASTGRVLASGTLEYDADRVGGFVTDQIDIPLPWQQLSVEVTGRVNEVRVDKTYTFRNGSGDGGRIYGTLEENNNRVEVAVLSKLKMLDYRSEGGTDESFKLLGNVNSRVTEQVTNGHKLEVEVYASDGTSNMDYRIESKLVYHVDGVGAYVSERIDTSDLLPWRRLTVEVTGSIRGFSVHQRFHFMPGDRETTPVEQ